MLYNTLYLYITSNNHYLSHQKIRYSRYIFVQHVTRIKVFTFVASAIRSCSALKIKKSICSFISNFLFLPFLLFSVLTSYINFS